jgi:dihydroorotase-like cyclic amidohydrolase
MMRGPCPRRILGSTVEKEESMTQDMLEEMGPVDYVVLEWPGRQPKGEVAPMILELVDRGIIRILDVALMVKGNDGSVAAIDLGETNGDSAGFDEFMGASTGLLGQEDLEEAAAALAPGTSAAVLVWENRWAAPIAVALRKSGGQLVASGRIEIQAILAALDALEENSAVTN